MERIKAIVPAADQEAGNKAILGHIKLVDADTGEEIECLQDVSLEFPMGGPVVAVGRMVVAEIETVPAERIAQVFPTWRQAAEVGYRGPSPAAAE